MTGPEQSQCGEVHDGRIAGTGNDMPCVQEGSGQLCVGQVRNDGDAAFFPGAARKGDSGVRPIGQALYNKD